MLTVPRNRPPRQVDVIPVLVQRNRRQVLGRGSHPAGRSVHFPEPRTRQKPMTRVVFRVTDSAHFLEKQPAEDPVRVGDVAITMRQVHAKRSENLHVDAPLDVELRCWRTLGDYPVFAGSAAGKPVNPRFRPFPVWKLHGIDRCRQRARLQLLPGAGRRMNDHVRAAVTGQQGYCEAMPSV